MLERNTKNGRLNESSFKFNFQLKSALFNHSGGGPEWKWNDRDEEILKTLCVDRGSVLWREQMNNEI